MLRHVSATSGHVGVTPCDNADDAPLAQPFSNAFSRATATGKVGSGSLLDNDITELVRVTNGGKGDKRSNSVFTCRKKARARSRAGICGREPGLLFSIFVTYCKRVDK